jgi:hypothetical protein
VALSPEMVNFVRLHIINEIAQLASVIQIAVIEEKSSVRVVGVSVNMIKSIGIERA